MTRIKTRYVYLVAAQQPGSVVEAPQRARMTERPVPALGLVHRRASDTYTAKFEKLMDAYEGTPIEVSFRALAGPLTVDESAQALHPYPARLLRHIPRFLLGCQQLVEPGDLVLDPFCGSGTVLTEAMRWGCHAWGLDVNPLAILISTVKTSGIDLAGCTDAALSVARTAHGYRRSLQPLPLGLEYWFGAESARALQHLSRSIEQQSTPVTNDFLRLCLSLTVDAVAHKDRRIPVPVRPRGEPLPTGDRLSVFDAFRRLAIETTRRLGRLLLDRPNVRSTVEVGDAKRFSPGTLGKPKLVMTSPPYGAAQKYARSTAHSLQWLGLLEPGGLPQLEHKMIGREYVFKQDVAAPPEVHNKEVRAALEDIRERDPYRAAVYATYFNDMAGALQSIANNTEPGSNLVLVASDNTVAGQSLPTHHLIATLAADYGYRTKLILRDRIIARSLTTKRAKTAGSPIHHEYIHVLTKEKP